MPKRPFRTAISGSFLKFKPEIDVLHTEFLDHDVEVLEPSTGWLWTPMMQVAPVSFRPLPDERGMSVRAIEDRFLRAIDASDFLYVYCPEGYIGPSTSFEIGYALAGETPVYASSSPDFMEPAEGDLEHKVFLESAIVVAGVAQVVRSELAKLEHVSR